MDKMLLNVLDMLRKGDNVVAGVSGGADSMVLLHLLNKARQKLDFNLLVVHVEHGIRNQESINDANFVKNYCDKNSIDCKIINIDVPKLAKIKKQTVEECARIQRYKAFEKFTKNAKLFLAHNKNDHAETVLMHIFRGSGIDGARGIVNRDGICRPLLNFTKKEILDFAKSNNVDFVEDSTNASSDYARNNIRNNILPQIEQIYPKIVENLVKFADFCNKSEELVSKNIDPKWINKKNNIVNVSLEAFSSNDLVLAKVIKTAYNLCGEFADLESKHIQMVQNLALTCQNGAIINLPHNIVSEKRNNSILFYKNQQNLDYQIQFNLGTNNLANGKQIDVKFVDKVGQFSNNVYFLDYNKIPKNAVWRTRKNGDVFNKLGSKGKKKLNDYFTDKKLSKPERDSAVLLANENQVLLVLGQDISEQVKIDEKTIQIVQIDYKKLD